MQKGQRVHGLTHVEEVLLVHCYGATDECGGEEGLTGRHRPLLLVIGQLEPCVPGHHG